MKTAFAAALLSLCLSAQAFYILIDAGPAAWLAGHRVEQVSVELFNGDPAIPGELARSRQPFDAANLKAVNGQIVAMTEAEIVARDEAEAQAAQEAAAEQAAQASLPATFETGIAVTNSAGHWVQFVPDGTNVVAETLAIQVSQSPLTPAQHDAMLAAALASRATKRAEAKAAKKAGQLQRRIEALESLMGVE